MITDIDTRTLVIEHAERGVEIERLRARIAELEGHARPKHMPFPHEWKLSPTEAEMLALLMQREFVEVTVRPRVRQHVHFLREKLRPFGIVVDSSNRRGYFLAGKARQAVAAAVAKRREGV